MCSQPIQLSLCAKASRSDSSSTFFAELGEREYARGGACADPTFAARCRRCPRRTFGPRRRGLPQVDADRPQRLGVASKDSSSDGPWRPAARGSRRRQAEATSTPTGRVRRSAAPRQQVFGPDLFRAQFAGLFLSQHDRDTGAATEPLEHRQLLRLYFWCTFCRLTSRRQRWPASSSRALARSRRGSLRAFLHRRSARTARSPTAGSALVNSDISIASLMRAKVGPPRDAVNQS